MTWYTDNPVFPGSFITGPEPVNSLELQPSQYSTDDYQADVASPVYEEALHLTKDDGDLESDMAAINWRISGSSRKAVVTVRRSDRRQKRAVRKDYVYY